MRFADSSKGQGHSDHRSHSLPDIVQEERGVTIQGFELESVYHLVELVSRLALV